MEGNVVKIFKRLCWFVIIYCVYLFFLFIEVRNFKCFVFLGFWVYVVRMFRIVLWGGFSKFVYCCNVVFMVSGFGNGWGRLDVVLVFI